MMEEILLSQHECVIMGDFNLPNIDWTLQRQTPSPGNKLMQLLADNNLTQHVHETTRHNNILDLVISMEEELIIVNLKITDKIGDHQAIISSIKTEKGNIASEKNNYNFRTADFDAMRTELDYQTFEQPIIRNNAELGFKILKSRAEAKDRSHIRKTRVTSGKQETHPENKKTQE